MTDQKGGRGARIDTEGVIRKKEEGGDRFKEEGRYYATGWDLNQEAKYPNPKDEPEICALNNGII